MTLTGYCGADVVHFSQRLDYLLEVPHAANSQCHQQLKASVDGGRRAAHGDGLLGGQLSVPHVLQVHVGRGEDKVVNQFL